ncbi:MAG: hypothetical protein HOV66_10530 [Streptomycetaceae bacterium]|nr:hypothetical protein [Streptomycetaceae bacterium]
MAVVESRPVAVAVGRCDAVRLWDLASGKQVGAPLTTQTGRVSGVAMADGVALALTAHDGGVVGRSSAAFPVDGALPDVAAGRARGRGLRR